jgi:hypothetical protein
MGMRPFIGFLAPVLTLATLACAPTNADDATTGDDANLTQTKAADAGVLVGKWSRDDQAQREAIAFAADGTYVRDRRASLAEDSAPFLRETGTYTVSKKDDHDLVVLQVKASGKLTPRAEGGDADADAVTPKTDGKSEELSYEHVEGGGGIGGQRPAQLLLQSTQRSGNLGSPLRIFDQVTTWCVVASDCATGTVCNTRMNTCGPKR